MKKRAYFADVFRVPDCNYVPGVPRGVAPGDALLPDEIHQVDGHRGRADPDPGGPLHLLCHDFRSAVLQLRRRDG